MITGKLTAKDCWTGFRKVVKRRFLGTPFFINLEVTKNCNARCSFCDYWKTKKEDRLEDYLPLVKRLSPLHVSITGGEPLLRKDLAAIIRRLREGDFIYLSLITNGSLLTEARAVEIWDAGLHQLGISLDFLDERHDRHRGIPGLYSHLEDLIPRLVKNTPIDNISLQTIIMDENLDQILPIAERAAAWGVKVSYSTYCSHKNSNESGKIQGKRIIKLRETIEELLKAKKRLGNILSSDFYLSRIPEYFEKGAMGGCLAGRKWIQITPDGSMKPCSEFPVAGKWTDYKPGFFKPVDCDVCWFSCRGEAQNSLTLKRIWQLNTMPQTGGAKR